MKGTLVKTDDIRLNTDKPAFNNVGQPIVGEVIQWPRINSVCIVGDLKTSLITDVVARRKNKIVFATLNSIYELTTEAVELIPEEFPDKK